MQKRRIFLVFVVMATLVFSSVSGAYALNVSGEIIDAVWDTNDSPVLVDGDLRVGNLTISQGVEILFTGNFKIFVNGIFVATGSKNNPIIFQPALINTNGWGGFIFENTPDGSRFEWCIFKGARNGSVLKLLSSYPVIRHCTFKDNQVVDYGGAIYAKSEISEDLTIDHCYFENNGAGTSGGAIWSNIKGKIFIDHCIFILNWSNPGKVARNTSGGAITISGDSEITGSYFRSNKVHAYTIYAAHGVYAKGGALYIENGMCEITGCSFLQNVCLMTAHIYTPDTSYAFGGGVYLNSGQMIMKNNLLAENKLSAQRRYVLRGSAVYIGSGSTTLIENITAVYNQNAPAIYDQSEYLTLKNSIVYFNFNSGLQMEGSLSATYCDIQGGYPSDIVAYDLNPGLDEYYQITSVSPMIDMGDPGSSYNDTCFPPSRGGIRNDIGFQGGPGIVECLDNDGDGVADCAEECAGDPNKIDPGQCGCENPDIDTDGDEVADCVDECPDDSDKIVSGQCGCGHPDIDTDKDGLANCVDDCPSDPGKTEPGLCGCGVSDADSDKDGTVNCQDECPNDKNKTEPGLCGCGNPDTDVDGDGIIDCNDQCKNDPNKTSPGQCGCGYPDIDTDKDGVADCAEECAGDPNKIDPGQCGCENPDIDTDGDEVADCVDECPDDSDKIVSGQCGCGHPDIDTDKDGLANCVDDCPSDPGKTEPGLCGCGVSDADSDKDGTVNCQDECPNDKNKTEPGLCGCGNPDTDVDGDGYYCNDGCPNNPNKMAPGKFGCGIIYAVEEVYAAAGDNQIIEVEDSCPISGAIVIVPPGVLKSDCRISIGIPSKYPVFPSNIRMAGHVLEFEPSGDIFLNSVTVKIPYTDEDLEYLGISDPEKLQLFRFDEADSIWKEIAIDRVDTETQTVVFRLERFSLYALGLATSPPKPDPPSNSNSGGGDGGGGCFIGTIF